MSGRTWGYKPKPSKFLESGKAIVRVGLKQPDVLGLSAYATGIDRSLVPAVTAPELLSLAHEFLGWQEVDAIGANPLTWPSLFARIDRIKAAIANAQAQMMPSREGDGVGQP